jgi:hypothetical protein
MRLIAIMSVRRTLHGRFHAIVVNLSKYPCALTIHKAENGQVEQVSLGIAESCQSVLKRKVACKIVRKL